MGETVFHSMEHPAPRAITTPPILGLHPMKTLHPRTSPYHMYPPQEPHMANTQVASSGKTCPHDSS
jgi:hypothetical protein